MWNRWFVVGWITPVCVALILVVIVAFVASPRSGSVSVQPPALYTVYGIDVSHHQGAIDWFQVARSGEVAFVWIKATEGARHTDSRFGENWRGARKSGLAVGAYHYYSMCRTGQAQAAHFIATVPRSAQSFPHAVDVEPDARCNRVAPSDLAAELTDFLDRLEAHYGVRPLLYSTTAYRAEHVPDLRAGAWTAAYSRRPSGSWHFWQYTPRGRIAGIRGPVDRNVFAGTQAEFEALVGRGASSAFIAR
jgi:lysozyme